MPEEILCCSCDRDCSTHHIMCDRDEDDEVWCPECFGTTSCAKGVHGEGCATSVFSDSK